MPAFLLCFGLLAATCRYRGRHFIAAFWGGYGGRSHAKTVIAAGANARPWAYGTGLVNSSAAPRISQRSPTRLIACVTRDVIGYRQGLTSVIDERGKPRPVYHLSKSFVLSPSYACAKKNFIAVRRPKKKPASGQSRSQVFFTDAQEITSKELSIRGEILQD